MSSFIEVNVAWCYDSKCTCWVGYHPNWRKSHMPYASKGLGATSEAHAAQHEPGLPGKWWWLVKRDAKNRTKTSRRHTWSIGLNDSQVLARFLQPHPMLCWLVAIMICLYHYIIQYSIFIYHCLFTKYDHFLKTLALDGYSSSITAITAITANSVRLRNFWYGHIHHPKYIVRSFLLEVPFSIKMMDIHWM